MRFCSRAHFRLFNWIAIFAIAFGFLAPVVNCVAAVGNLSQERMEICTAAGMVYVAVTDQQPDGSQQEKTVSGKCCCPAQAGALALLSGENQTLPFFAPFIGLPPASHEAAPRQSFIWAIAFPRAPPALFV